MIGFPIHAKPSSRVGVGKTDSSPVSEKGWYFQARDGATKVASFPAADPKQSLSKRLRKEGPFSAPSSFSERKVEKKKGELTLEKEEVSRPESKTSLLTRVLKVHKLSVVPDSLSTLATDHDGRSEDCALSATIPAPTSSSLVAGTAVGENGEAGTADKSFTSPVPTEDEDAQKVSGHDESKDSFLTSPVSSKLGVSESTDKPTEALCFDLKGSSGPSRTTGTAAPDFEGHESDAKSAQKDVKSAEEDVKSAEEDVKSAEEDVKSAQKDVNTKKQELNRTRANKSTTKWAVGATTAGFLGAASLGTYVGVAAVLGFANAWNPLGWGILGVLALIGLIAGLIGFGVCLYKYVSNKNRIKAAEADLKVAKDQLNIVKANLVAEMYISSFEQGGVNIEIIKSKFSEKIKDLYNGDESSLLVKFYYLFYAFGLYYYPVNLSPKEELRNNFVSWLKDNIGIKDEIINKISKSLFDSLSPSFYSRFNPKVTTTVDDIGVNINGINISFMKQIKTVEEHILHNRLKSPEEILTKFSFKVANFIKEKIYPTARKYKFSTASNDSEGSSVSEAENELRKQLFSIQRFYISCLDKKSLVEREGDLENFLFYVDFKDSIKDIYSLYEEGSLYNISLVYKKNKGEVSTLMLLDSQNRFCDSFKHLSENDLKAFNDYYIKRNELLKKPENIAIIKQKFPDLAEMNADDILQKVIVGDRADNTLLARESFGQPFEVDRNKEIFYHIVYHKACEVLKIDDSKPENQLCPGYWDDLRKYLSKLESK